MPITVTAPRGVLTAEGERQILPRLTAELIDVSGAAGNSFFEPIVGAPSTSSSPNTSTAVDALSRSSWSS
jgi:hypothetical protein